MPDARKTLLLLGGARHQVPAIETAKRLGCRTVLCDYLPDNPGQYVADVFYQKSTTDRELMLQIARAEHIDGVLAFGTDVALPSAGYVAETLGLPTNPLSSIMALSEKYRFRATLTELGLPCPAFASFAADATAEQVMALVEGFSYPLIMKPTDSSGSKGVTVIQSPEAAMFEAALRSAQEYSRNRVLVVEEFIEQTFPHIIGGDIFVSDGRIEFWGLMGAIRDRQLGGLVPVGEAYPSGLPAALEQRVRADLQRLVSGLDLRFGEMNVEVLIGPDDTPYIIELAGRAGGNMIPTQLQDISGIDLVEASVRAALGWEQGEVHFEGNGAACATYMLHPMESGKFVGVTYEPELAQHVYREELFVEPGSEVQRLTNSGQNVGIAFLRFDSPAQMWDTLDCVDELVHVKIAR